MDDTFNEGNEISGMDYSKYMKDYIMDNKKSRVGSWERNTNIEH